MSFVLMLAVSQHTDTGQQKHKDIRVGVSWHSSQGLPLLSGGLYSCCSVFHLGVGCVTTHWPRSAKNTKVGLSQHSDTHTDFKVGCLAVTTHWHPQKHQGWVLGCHNTLTPTKTPRLDVGLSQHIDTHKNTKVWLSQHTDSNKNTKAGCCAVTTQWHHKTPVILCEKAWVLSVALVQFTDW